VEGEPIEVSALPSQQDQSLRLLLASINDRRRRELVGLVTSDYISEVRSAQVHTDLAGKLRNRQLRSAVESVAEVERRHAVTLAELIKKLGGSPPADPPPLTGTPWELLMHAYDIGGADFYRYIDRQYEDGLDYLRDVYAELAEEEKQNKRIIREVAQSVDPASLGGMTTLP